MHPAAIGPFAIERELGRGGMGVVYLARDTRLDRQVAIKALPPHLTEDEDRLARFQREAKVLASLNHSGIGAIYGLEHDGGHQYLILEYVEGETLADRLARGAVPMDEALDIARQVAEALEAAHEKGVIHRDLKPANVMLTRDGAVKVLDFGLARTQEGLPSSAADPHLAHSPTMTSPARHSPTIPGAIMGTAGYMSPEQARGRPVDKRSDIFSFGCVLYEMLTGAMPFQGETVADAIGATLHKETDLAQLPAATPPTIRLLLVQCLTKDRANRLRDIGDARLTLAQAISNPAMATLGMGSAPAGSRRRGLPLAPALALAAVAIIGGTFPLWSHSVGLTSTPEARAAPPKQVVRFTIEPPTGFTLPLFIGNGSGIAISPAGDRIVFRATADGKSHLCVRNVAEGQARVLPNTEGCQNPFFSPDGTWLGFVSNERLMKMPAEGGPALTLCEVANFASFAWLDDGTIVWGASSSGIWRVSADGGRPTQVTKAGPDTKAPEGGLPALGFDVPVNVPGADYILCSSWDGPTTESFNVLAVSLKDGSLRTVARTATEPRLIARNRLLFMRGTTVMTVEFDPLRVAAVGEPAVALEGVRTDQWQDSAYIGASNSGAFAYVPGGRYGSGKRLVRVDATGTVTPLLDTTDNYNAWPAISPDGRRAVFTTLRSKIEMWLLDLDRRSISLFSSAGEFYGPTWSVDGAFIIAQHVALDGTTSISRWPVSGGEPSVLPGTNSPKTFLIPIQELPDGSGLLVRSLGVDIASKLDLALYNYSTAALAPVRNRPANEGDASVSSDGKWIAYASDESGRSEVYLGPLGSSGPNVRVSTQGGRMPRFSRDGKRLLFASEDGLIMAASVDMQGTAPIVSAPEKLFDYRRLNLQASVDRDGFDVLPSGDLVMIERAVWEKEPPVIHVILNWADELSAKQQRR